MSSSENILSIENKKLEFKSAMVENKKFAKTTVAFSDTNVLHSYP